MAKETYSKFLKEEKKKLIKQFGLDEGLQRWNKMQEKGWVKKNNKNMKIRPA